MTPLTIGVVAPNDDDASAMTLEIATALADEGGQGGRVVLRPLQGLSQEQCADLGVSHLLALLPGDDRDEILLRRAAVLSASLDLGSAAASYVLIGSVDPKRVEALPRLWRTEVLGIPGEQGVTIEADPFSLGVLHLSASLRRIGAAKGRAVQDLRPGDHLGIGQMREVRRLRLRARSAVAKLLVRMGLGDAPEPLDRPLVEVDLPWRRYTSPADSSPHLVDGGFLLDPTSEWSRFVSQQATSLRDHPQAGALAILGDAGLGKSKELARLFDSCESPKKHIDLAFEVRDVADLEAGIFDPQLLEQALSGDQPYTVFLDSLDEGRIDPTDALACLSRGMSKHQMEPGDHLRIRVACRTSGWAPSTSRLLQRLWRDDALELQLAPLTREAAALAAEHLLGDRAEEFMDQVIGLGLAPLAAHPLLLLGFLLPSYSGSGRLDGSRLDQFAQGCIRLADEWSDVRRDRSAGGERLTPSQRLAHAQRIAWVSILSGRPGIWVGSPSDGDGALDIQQDELVQLLDVSAIVLDEVLATGLFTRSGHPSRRRYLHRSVAEFLAARHACEDPSRARKTIELARVQVGDERRIPAQLAGLVAWMASQSRVALELLTDVDPRALVEGGVDLDHEGRAHLIDKLFERHRAGIEPVETLDHAAVSRLGHRLLSDQLLPVLTGDDDPTLRSAAARLLSAAPDSAATQALVDRALDGEEDLRVRVSAAAALPDNLSDELAGRLRPLVVPGDPADDSDELRGAALRRLWPGRLAPEGLFEGLRPPKQRNLLGLYKLFLHQPERVVEGLAPGDLPIALAWVRTVGLGGRSDARQELAWAIIERAWDRIDDAGIAAALGETLAGPLVDLPYPEDRIFWTRGDPRRLVLARHVVPHLPLRGGRIELFGLERAGLLAPDDLQWVKDRRDEGGEGRWGDVVDQLNPPPLDPERVAQARQRHEEHERTMNRIDAERARQFPAFSTDRVAAVLDLDGASPETIWRQLHWELWRKEAGHRPEPLAVSVRESPGWSLVDAELRDRIVAAVRAHIAEADPGSDQWFASGSHGHGPVVGWHAWELVWSQDRDWILGQPASRWADWAPVLLDAIVAKGDAYRELAGETFRRAPDVWLALWDRLIDAADHPAKLHRPVELAEAAWGAEMAAHVLASVRDATSVPARTRRSLLALLHRQDDAHARRWCEEHAEQQGVAASLLLAARDAGWQTVWALSLRHPDVFERELCDAIEETAWEHRPASLLDRLPDAAAVADLGAWLIDTYPPEEDPEHHGVYSPDRRDRMGEFRSGLLRWLEVRGEPEALLSLRKRFPDKRWLARLAIAAADRQADDRWRPASVAQLVALDERPTGRFVHDSAHLLELVLEALSDVQRETIDGRHAAAEILFGGKVRPPHRPADEVPLTKWLADQLETALGGTIVNREVQVRPNDERPDMKIDATEPDGAPHTVYVEVKGCWHPDVKTAMRSQLVAQYLDVEPRGYGVYLVFWFDQEDWQETDYRRAAAAAHFSSAAEAQQALDEQAAAINAEGLHRVRAKVLRVRLGKRA